ncbi:Rgp1-domain-containing protein [Stereum hirsutum FP-91666 SS1]|uniref:Rgp1-domain-containing protein n=1 Tax=Stereum hirsutum (strain FP-91666) TaxID=721885 RepID=UPI000440F068|nr:Rgp1-domain-containing protein [Stereum hirsutum FP-91666 SS1]EIM92050.1 Rgp1-domain-containing protein [Stereum hirsutum FP-91666 SS1]
MSTTADIDTALRVVVSPSQSSYFAGEPLQVTITITNTRSASEPANLPSLSAARHAHKRSAHSVSSAPLARPPTSPVPSSPRISSPLARTPSTSSDPPVPAHHPHARKPSLLEIPSQPTAAPLVNQPAHPFNGTLSQLPPVPQTASASASSFSVSLDPIAETLTSPIPQTPGIPSPITPSHSFAPTSVPAPLINGRSRSKSGDALTNGHAYPPRGPPTTTTTNDNTNTRKPAQHALGHGLPSSSSLTDLGSSSTPHKPPPPKRQSTLPTLGPLPNSELVLYAYVQLTGLATLAPTASASNTRSVPLGALRDKYTKARGMVCGGGSMDITGSVSGMGGGMGTPMMGSGGVGAGMGGMGAARKRHARSTSLTAGLLSLLSPALGGGGGSIPSHSSVPSGVGSTGVGGASAAGSGWTPGHRNRTSYIGSLFSPSVSSFSIPPTPKTATGVPPQSQSQSQNPGGKGVGLGLGVDGNVPNGNGHVGVANGYGPGHRNGHVNGGSVVVRERQREYIPAPPQGMLVDEWDPETALPVFEVRPAMLAVDLSLGPGESRSYTYTVALPSHLPPTFKGRSLKFSYELAVGTCRASTSSKPPSNASNSSLGGSPSINGSTSTSSSRVMKVPIRVYNHVSVDRPQRPYDLLGLPSSSPEIPAEAKVAEIEVPLTVPVLTHKQALFGVGAGNGNGDGDGDGEYRNQISSPVSPSLSPLPPLKGSIGDLRMYGLRLLHDAEQDKLLSPSITSPNGAPSLSPSSASSLSPSSASSLSPSSALSPPTSALSPISEPDDAPTGTLRGCREAVEILTRVPKKVSYDVHKDGVKVAVLTFTKQAWRLGETVVGVVEVNERSGRGRVLKLSAMLEAHESLPADLSAPSDARYLKRVHAEHHTSFVASTSRTTFSLDIPSDASPAFQVSLDPPSSSPTPPTYTYGQPFNTNGQSIGSGSKKGGLEWKVRLCLLVAVAKPNTWAGKEGVRIKGLVRQGAKGEWGSSWVPTGGIGGLERVLGTPPAASSSPPGLNGKGVGMGAGARDGSGNENGGEKGKTKSWGEFFASAFLGPTENAFHDGDLDSYSSEEEEEEDDLSSISSSDSPGRRDRAGKGRGGKGKGGKGEEDLGGGKDGWTELGVEMVECEVPVKVWPGNTAFRAMDVLFDV